jgi:hypothetical protein
MLLSRNVLLATFSFHHLITFRRFWIVSGLKRVPHWIYHLASIMVISRAGSWCAAALRASARYPLHRRRLNSEHRLSILCPSVQRPED